MVNLDEESIQGDQFVAESHEKFTTMGQFIKKWHFFDLFVIKCRACTKSSNIPNHRSQLVPNIKKEKKKNQYHAYTNNKSIRPTRERSSSQNS
jgi:hypothetical protein